MRWKVVISILLLATAALFGVARHGLADNTVSITSDQQNYIGDGQITSLITLKNNGSGGDMGAAAETFAIQFNFPGNAAARVSRLEAETATGGWQPIQTANRFRLALAAGETKQLRATIAFPEGSRGEFTVTALGDRGGYGFLDPGFASYAVVARGGGALAGGAKAVAVRGGGHTTFTLVQEQGASVNSGNPFTISYTTTGSGDLLFIENTNDNGGSVYISSVSGGGTWIVAPGCQEADNTVGAMSCAYVLSSTGGSTTSTITMSSALGTNRVVFYEYSYTNGPISFDAANTNDNSSASTTQLGAPLVLSGLNDVIFQWIGENNYSNPVSSVTSPYSINLATTSYFGFTSVDNVATGTAPTWTLSAAGGALSAAASFKGSSGGIGIKFR